MWAKNWQAKHCATELLGEGIASGLRELGLNALSLKKIACVVGPGSFTGIRLVLTCAQALRRTVKSYLAPLLYTEALAFEANLVHNYVPNTMLFVTTHARRNLVHFQPFVVREVPVAVGKIELKTGESVLSMMTPQTVCLGSAVPRNPILAQRECSLGNIVPSPKTWVKLAACAHYVDADLSAVYVRTCDAEENLERLAQRQGMLPEWAKKQYELLLQKPPLSSI